VLGRAAASFKTLSANNLVRFFRSSASMAVRPPERFNCQRQADQ
jgi:hypothetical protein